jgi:hypothetical protein
MDITLNNKSLEKQKNISFYIKNLPNELIECIFSYVSLVPFDKKKFMMYITNYKADYAEYLSDLMAFHKNSMYREYIPYDGCRTHINDDIWNYVFFRKYDTKHMEMKTAFMYDVMKCKSFNKSQCYNILRKELSKDISNRSISRLKLDELRTILFTYYYRYN